MELCVTPRWSAHSEKYTTIYIVKVDLSLMEIIAKNSEVEISHG